MMRSFLVLFAVVAALFFICVQCAPKEISLYKQEPARSPIRVFATSSLDTIGGGNLLGRALDRLEDERTLYNLRKNQLTSKYYIPEEIGWELLLDRSLDSIGGNNLLGREVPGDIGGDGLIGRGLDSIGGSHLLGRDIGAGYRHRGLDSIGGNNLLGRDAMPCDIGC